MASVSAADLSRPAATGGSPSEAIANMEYARLFHSDEWGKNDRVNIADFNMVHGGNEISARKLRSELRSFQSGIPGIYHSNDPIAFQQDLGDAQFRRIQVRSCKVSVVAPAVYAQKLTLGADPATMIIKNPLVKASTHRFVAEHQWLHRCLACPLNLLRLHDRITAELPAHLLDVFKDMMNQQVVFCTITIDDVLHPAPMGSQAAVQKMTGMLGTARNSHPTVQHLLARSAGASSSRAPVLSVGDDAPEGGIWVVDLS